MYVQELEPVAGSPGLSALVATLPLVIVLVLLGGVRLKVRLAGLIGLLAAVLVARLAAPPMPLGQTLSSAAQGAVFGLFPTIWIVVDALWCTGWPSTPGTSTSCAAPSDRSPTTRASRHSSSRSASAPSR